MTVASVVPPVAEVHRFAHIAPSGEPYQIVVLIERPAREEARILVVAYNARVRVARTRFFETLEGSARFEVVGEGTFVEPAHRRHGIATQMYLAVGHYLGFQIEHGHLSDDGKAFSIALAARWPVAPDA